MPIINLTDEQFFKRNEKYGQVTIFLKESQQQIYLNEIGMLIFNLCRIENDYKIIAKKIKEQFQDISHKQILDDVVATINVLRVYGITNKNKKVINVSEKICFAGDLNYIGLSKFICDNFDNSESFLINTAYDDYSPLSLRSKTMTNSEYYICHYDNGKLNFVLIVTPPRHPMGTSVVAIKGYVTNLREANTKIEVLSSTFNHLKENIGVNFNKIRTSMLEEDITDSKYINIIDLLKQSGFKHECTLENEIGNQDLHMYTLFM